MNPGLNDRLDYHLDIQGLSIKFDGQDQYAVQDVNLQLPRGQCLGLVGESGSGKSITALATMQLLPFTASVARHSRVMYDKQDLLSASERAMRRVRGRKIAMIFQDALTALNPVFTIGQQLREIVSSKPAKRQALCLLDEVGIKNVKQCYNSYPHQLSGGMRQRAMIAMALAGEPELLIADEPTTALDVTIQAQVVELLKGLQRQRGMSLLFISHDLALVSQLADKVVVMQQGRVVETNDSGSFFRNPQTEYARRLLAAIPDGQVRQQKPEDKPALLEVSGLKVYFPIKKGVFKRTVGHVKAVDDVSFSIAPGQTLAIVGESGSGKTTSGLALLQLLQATAGNITFDGKSLLQSSKADLRQLRIDTQIVFQDPYSALNPRRQVGDSIAEGLWAQKRVRTRREAMARVDALLQQVQMPTDIKLRYPHEFSGGQRQRLCIARALALQPKLLVLDEPTSALDVSIQEQILDLLYRLQQQHNLAYLLITHDFGVVAQMAHHIVVMLQGKVVEQGTAVDILQSPQHLYTQQLLAAVPQLKLEEN